MAVDTDTLTPADLQELGLMLDTLADWLQANGGHGLPVVKTRAWSIRLLSMADIQRLAMEMNQAQKDSMHGR